MAIPSIGAAPARLPADLARLRERFLAEYPGAGDRVARLALVPPALRHVLSLRLELDRVDALPRRYFDLARAALSQQDRDDSEADDHSEADAVDELVCALARATRENATADAQALMPALRRYFTEPQLVELVLNLTLIQAFATFDALLLASGDGRG